MGCLFAVEIWRDLAKNHVAAIVVEVWGEGDGNAEVLGEKGLGREFAHVDAHADAFTLFEIATFFNVDVAALEFGAAIGELDFCFSHFAGSHKPSKEPRGKPGIQFTDEARGGK